MPGTSGGLGLIEPLQFYQYGTNGKFPKKGVRPNQDGGDQLPGCYRGSGTASTALLVASWMGVPR